MDQGCQMMRVHMALYKLWITINNCTGNTSFADVGGWTYLLSQFFFFFFISHLCAVGEQQSASCTCKNKPNGIYKLKMEIQRNKYSTERVRDHVWNLPGYTIRHCIQIVGTVDQPQKEQIYLTLNPMSTTTAVFHWFQALISSSRQTPMTFSSRPVPTRTSKNSSAIFWALQ